MLAKEIDYLSIIYVLTSLALLSSSRLGMLVKAAAVQGVILALIPVAKEWNHLDVAAAVLCLVTLIIKGGIFPRLLMSTVRRAGIKREVEPMVGYSSSLLVGLAMLVFSFWLHSRLPIGDGAGPLLLPAAFFGIFCGFFLTLARRKALTQILGYLVLENGIFAFGAAALSDHPWMLELGILLDVLVAVFIMGFALLHISREFEHMDADRLASLHDFMEEGS